jgi:hypothetical protein
MYIKLTVHTCGPHRETELIQVRIDNRSFTQQLIHLFVKLKTVPCTLLLAILSSMLISPSTRLYDCIYIKGFRMDEHIQDNYGGCPQTYAALFLVLNRCFREENGDLNSSCVLVFGHSFEQFRIITAIFYSSCSVHP